MAYLRVLRAHIDPAKIPELLEIDEMIATALEGTPGLLYRAGTVPDADGHGLVVTVWETREQAETQLLSARSPEIAERIKSMGLEIESSDIAEVTGEYRG